MTTPTAPEPAPTRRSTPFARVALVIVGLYLVAAIPLILFAGALGPRGEDQIVFHEPTVHTFASQLPNPDLRDYLSATTPGYHLVLAVVERVISGDARVLQAAGALFTVALLALLARTVCSLSAGGWRESLILCLPVACSMYVFQAGVWMLPDNAGWLAVLACLALALREPFGTRTILLGGAALVALVLLRQVHLWAAGVLWAAAWLAPGINPAGRLRDILDRLPDRIRALTPMLVASIPAFLVLGWFMRLWGGLVPPFFQKQYAQMSLASYAFLLSLLGIASIFFVGYLADPLADLMKKSKRTGALFAGAAGALAAVIPSTTYSVEDGRFSGLWNLARLTPSIAGHTSPLIVILAAFGAVMLLVWCRALPARPRWIFLGAWFGFATAQAFSAQLWQRYNEPFVLIMLALMAAASRPTGSTPVYTRRLTAPIRLAGVGALALFLALLCTYTISRFQPATKYDPRLVNPPTTTTP